MRLNIWEKDDFFEIGGQRIDMDPSVVTLPEEVPLVWGFRFDDTAGPYGKVTELKLEDGEISGHVEFYDPTYDENTLEDMKCRLGGYYTSVQKNDDGAVVTKCELKGVSIMLLADTPGWNPAANPKM